MNDEKKTKVTTAAEIKPTVVAANEDTAKPEVAASVASVTVPEIEKKVKEKKKKGKDKDKKGKKGKKGKKK